MSNYKIQKFPKSRVATIDVCEVGKMKHHISALIEIDVTESRQLIKKYKKEINRISFTAWLIKVICHTINNNKNVAAFLSGKRKLLLFDEINVSLLVEKEINGERVPMPMLINKANEQSIESITNLINESKNEVLSGKDIVIHRKPTGSERLYYHMPGFIRIFVWKFLLNHPKLVFNHMGNVAITSLGMMAKINGWFIPISIHPISFGIGAIIKKPVVLNDEIKIREIMNMTVLIDHDVIDGASMARFLGELTKNIETGIYL